MLVAISAITSELEKAIVKRLFSLGDINLKTKHSGQTALMLAASHGKLTTVQLLLHAGADVNIQDKVSTSQIDTTHYKSLLPLSLSPSPSFSLQEGSTALMCAADNGHTTVVKLLLCHFETDVNLTDNAS